MQRIWVLCKKCDSSDAHNFFGAKSIGMGNTCPSCGSGWKQNQIIASTVEKGSSEILGDIRVMGPKSPVKVIWLDT